MVYIIKNTIDLHIFETPIQIKNTNIFLVEYDNCMKVNESIID